MTNNQFLGRGWKFPQPGGTQIVLSDFHETVRQSIWMILSTVPGERVMRPDFGCGIHEMIYGLNTSGTIGAVVDTVQRALIRWEPRIDVLEVRAEYDPDEPNKLLIEIDYKLRTENSRFNLVYPFYIG